MPTMLHNFINLYHLAAISKQTRAERTAGLDIRRVALAEITGDVIVKRAFDTRRINQDVDYNPRRNLQNYHRSEQLLSDAQVVKKTNLTKLYDVCAELKNKYEQEPEWQDSYCRVLYNTLNNALRIGQADQDFSDTATSIGSWDYVEEMLFARYRLDMNSLESYGTNRLKDILLQKDTSLINKTSIAPSKITKHDIATKSYDSLLAQLFADCKASVENPDVERTITITIRDKFNKDDIIEKVR